MRSSFQPIPTPVNQNPNLHDWDLDFASLRLETFLPNGLSLSNDAALLALVDDWGRIYPRERALIVIERLLAFYNSITDDQLDSFNCDIEGDEGGKVATQIRLERILFTNRNPDDAAENSSSTDAA